MAKRIEREPSQRQLRVGEQLKQALSEIFMRGEVHNPLIEQANLTVSEVRCSPDLRNATVFVLPLGGKDVPQALQALADDAGRIQKLISRKVTLKFTPRLTFRADETFDAFDTINKALNSPKARFDLAQPDEKGNGQ